MTVGKYLKTIKFWKIFTNYLVVGLSVLLLFFTALNSQFISQKISFANAQDASDAEAGGTFDLSPYYSSTNSDATPGSTFDLSSYYGSSDWTASNQPVNWSDATSGGTFDLPQYNYGSDAVAGGTFNLPYQTYETPTIYYPQTTYTAPSTWEGAGCSGTDSVWGVWSADGSRLLTTEANYGNRGECGGSAPSYTQPSTTASYPQSTSNSGVFNNPSLDYNNTGNIYYPYGYYAPYTYTYTDNSRYTSTVDSHDRVDSHAYQYADIGSFNDSHNDRHDGQFAQSGFNTTDNHAVSLSQGGGQTPSTSTQSVVYTQPAVQTPVFRGINYSQIGSGSETSYIDYRQYPVTSANYQTPVRYAITQSTASGSTYNPPTCPSGTNPVRDIYGNTICQQVVTQNPVIYPPVVTTTPAVYQTSGATQYQSEVLQPKVLSTTNQVAAELPKTGLPLAAWALGGLLPAGLGFRKFVMKKGIQSVTENANSIWVSRQMGK